MYIPEKQKHVGTLSWTGGFKSLCEDGLQSNKNLIDEKKWVEKGKQIIVVKHAIAQTSWVLILVKNIAHFAFRAEASGDK